ncbi:uncharacterized protein CEXT_801851 [Caerostris extrusa]|uniref:Uncharacterized protein n=1 Tax=Caerostris extrusa TaxID=172846 RepID=A0AAV4X2I6_CAEEX|nr:uncharacterized protein CEXT_801851 [Caerostris extrusa]
MFAKVVIFCAALAAAHASLVGPLGLGAPVLAAGPLGLGLGKGLIAAPAVATVSSQRTAINHVAPAAPIGAAAPSLSPMDSSVTDSSPTDLSPTELSPTDSLVMDSSPTESLETDLSEMDSSPTESSVTESSPTVSSPETESSPTDSLPDTELLELLWLSEPDFSVPQSVSESESSVSVLLDPSVLVLEKLSCKLLQLFDVHLIYFVAS